LTLPHSPSFLPFLSLSPLPFINPPSPLFLLYIDEKGEREKDMQERKSEGGFI